MLIVSLSAFPRGSGPGNKEGSDALETALTLSAGTVFASFLDGFVRTETAARLHSVFADGFFRSVNYLGEWKLFLPASLSVFGISRFLKWRHAERITGNMLVTYAVSGLAISAIRYPLGRERPFREKGNYSFRPFSGNDSFPSGHTQIIFTVLMTLGYEFGCEKYAFPAAFLVSFARVYLDKHWFSDIFFSAVLTTVVAKNIRGLSLRSSRRGNFFTYGIDFDIG